MTQRGNRILKYWASVSKLTKISLLIYAVLEIAIIISFSPLMSSISIGALSMISLILLLTLMVSSAVFYFITGYQKEGVVFYAVLFIAAVPPIIYAIYNVNTESNPVIGYVVSGMIISASSAAQVLRRIGLIVRRISVKDGSVRIVASIGFIILFLLVFIISFIFAGAMMMSHPPGIYN
jgi:hypothetical protein